MPRRRLTTNRSNNPCLQPRNDPALIGVLLADDHAIVRDGLRALVDGHAGLTVVGEADSGLEAWRLACKVKPDVVVIDLSMPGLSGIEATERTARDCPEVKVLALTMHEERGCVSRPARRAAGYALKRSASS
jgi:DNA-binding NarL/FixJ family response regulator